MDMQEAILTNKSVNSWRQCLSIIHEGDCKDDKCHVNKGFTFSRINLFHDHSGSNCNNWEFEC